MNRHMNVLLLITLLLLNGITDAATCIQHSDPLNPSIYTVTNCSSGSSYHNSKRDELSDSGSGTFKVIFNCLSTDSHQCDMVKGTFIKAGQVITSVIRLQRPVTVNATFMSFCSQLGECPDSDGGKTIVGSAYPAVSHMMTDASDNRTRMYPQALMKQIRNLGEIPSWGPVDINAKFNSDANWYIDGNGTVSKHQIDLLRTVIHEYMHGLGFLNSWNNYLWTSFQQVDASRQQFLTPLPLSPPNQLQSVYDNAQEASGPQPFWGFVEYPLDKLVNIVATNQPLSATTPKLNEWGGSNVMFASLADMYHSWQENDAISVAYKIYNLSTTADALSIYDPSFGNVILETSLSPYQAGSTLSHLDNDSYDSTNDYLMVYQADPGVSMQQYISTRGGGPVGPKLLSIMQKLGYDLVNATNTTQPSLKPWQQPANMVGTTDNPSPSVSHVTAFVSTTSASQTPTATQTNQNSFNSPSIHLSFIAVLLTFTFLLT